MSEGPHLTWLRRQSLRALTDGALREPSGLALGPDGASLWTVGDETGRLFRLLLDERGDTPVRLDPSFALDLGCVGLEGVAFKDAETLIAVQEYDPAAGTSVLVEHSLATGRTVRRPLSELRGYDALADDFGGSRANKGLEGITWDPAGRRWLALKEGRPGMLLAISEDLRSVAPVCTFDARAMGFAEKGSVDYSGMDHAGGQRIWIVSDEAQTLYLFDVQALQVLRRMPLTWGPERKDRKKGGKKDRKKGGKKGRKPSRLKKAEGVVYDAAHGRLHVVCDEQSELHTYAVSP